MFGKNPRLNPLELRKQLLIAESELNRVQLVQEWQTMADGARSLADRAGTSGSLVSAAASLMAGLASFRHSKPVNAEAKCPWLQTLLKGASLVSNFWLAFRSPDRGQSEK